MSTLLDNVASLNEIETTGLVILMGEVGSGKTTFTKTMPDAAGGDILYLPIGNDKGFSQLKGDPRFKTLIDDDGKIKPIKTVYQEKKGKKVAIKERVLNQLTETLEEFKEGNHNFKGLNIDAISTLQEQIENEVKFETGQKVDWDGWSSIKKGMFRIYELVEEIVEDGYHVVLQSHFQIREYTDNYSGETMSRTLPMMTENNAIRVLKNAAAVIFIKIMSDPKDPKVVKRMSIVGGHPTIPTKLRNNYNLSFDGILFENLDYAGAIKLMEIESLDNVENTTDLEDIQIKREAKSKPKKKKKSTKKPKKEEPVEETEEEVEEETKSKPKKKPSKKRKSMRKSKNKDVEEDVEEDVKEVKAKPKKKKPPKKKPKKVTPATEAEEGLPDDEDEVEEKPKKKKPPKKKKSTKKPKKQEDVEEDVLEDDEELEDDELFDEE